MISTPASCLTCIRSSLRAAVLCSPLVTVRCAPASHLHVHVFDDASDCLAKRDLSECLFDRCMSCCEGVSPSSIPIDMWCALDLLCVTLPMYVADMFVAICPVPSTNLLTHLSRLSATVVGAQEAGHCRRVRAGACCCSTGGMPCSHRSVLRSLLRFSTRVYMNQTLSNVLMVSENTLQMILNFRVALM